MKFFLKQMKIKTSIKFVNFMIGILFLNFFKLISLQMTFKNLKLYFYSQKVIKICNHFIKNQICIKIQKKK